MFFVIKAWFSKGFAKLAMGAIAVIAGQIKDGEIQVKELVDNCKKFVNIGKEEARGSSKRLVSSKDGKQAYSFSLGGRQLQPGGAACCVPVAANAAEKLPGIYPPRVRAGTVDASAAISVLTGQAPGFATPLPAAVPATNGIPSTPASVYEAPSNGISGALGVGAASILAIMAAGKVAEGAEERAKKIGAAHNKLQSRVLKTLKLKTSTKSMGSMDDGGHGGMRSMQPAALPSSSAPASLPSVPPTAAQQ